MLEILFVLKLLDIFPDSNHQLFDYHDDYLVSLLFQLQCCETSILPAKEPNTEKHIASAAVPSISLNPLKILVQFEFGHSHWTPRP